MSTGQLQSQSSESSHNVAERKKSNLAFAFFCMDSDRAKDMEIFYAFCRLMDDIADGETQPVEDRRAELMRWKDEIAAIYAGAENLTPLAEEMRGVIERRKIPQCYIQDIIDGVLTDTFPADFKTFDDVRRYCYGVASAVGLASIYIFGFKNPRTKLFAETLGYALQFTNILRDVVDDAISHGRVYIPQEELEAFGVSKDDLLDPSKNPACKKLFALMYFRAKHFFNKARRLIADEDRRALAPAFIMWGIYEEILERIKRGGFNIAAKPVKISKFGKIMLAMKAVRASKRQAPRRAPWGRVAVVGAGISGVAAALRLALDGFDVDVFESRGSVGGRVAEISAFGARLDNASHAAMGCYEYLAKALALCGTEMSEIFDRVRGMDFISPDSPEISVRYPERGAVARALSVLSYAKIGGFASWGNLLLLLGLKLGALPKCGETAAQFLARKKIPPKTVETFWRPFCVSALNTDLERADAVLMARTLQKCILKGFESALLYLPKRPIADAFAHFGLYMKACGSSVHFCDAVEKVDFDGRRALRLHSTKTPAAEFDYFVCALPAKKAAALLPQNSQTAAALARMEGTNIANIYFTTPQKIIEGDYACVVNSPIHWIFDHTRKLVGSSPLRLYAITISDSQFAASKQVAAEFLQKHLGTLFGNVEIAEVLPSFYPDATISADCQTEAARPSQSGVSGEFSNLNVVGDWVQTDLPCTMESAAKSAFELTFDK